MKSASSSQKPNPYICIAYPCSLQVHSDEVVPGAAVHLGDVRPRVGVGVVLLDVVHSADAVVAAYGVNEAVGAITPGPLRRLRIGASIVHWLVSESKPGLPWI